MATPNDRDALRRASLHVDETRRRLAEGQVEIRRQREVVAENDRHLSGISRWIAETDRALGRPQRATDEEPPAAA